MGLSPAGSGPPSAPGGRSPPIPPSMPSSPFGSGGVVGAK